MEVTVQDAANEKLMTNFPLTFEGQENVYLTIQTSEPMSELVYWLRNLLCL